MGKFEISQDINYRDFLVTKTNLNESDLSILDEFADQMGMSMYDIYKSAVNSYYNDKETDMYQTSDSIIEYMMNDIESMMWNTDDLTDNSYSIELSNQVYDILNKVFYEPMG